MSLYETAKANNIRDIPAWLLACGRAYYLYRANRTLTRRMLEGFKAGLDKNELLDFSKNNCLNSIFLVAFVSKCVVS